MDTRTLIASFRRSRLALPLALALAGPLACGGKSGPPSLAEPSPIARSAPHREEARVTTGDEIGARAEPFNTERYAKVDENPVHVTKDQPLSTFGIDVDTASFANVRRFIEGGQRPPTDAVRIEELVNYFPYAAIEPEPGHPLGIASEIGPCPWAPSHLLARVRVAAPEAAANASIKKNLVFLVDVSGSMADANKLPLLRSALTELTLRMTEDDRIGIVVYAGASGVVLEPTSNPTRIVEALGRLQAGGGTNGAGGIQAAYALARQNFSAEAVNRVVLATDGDFNVGTTSLAELEKLVSEERKSGVFLTVLGFGMGNYNDQTLELLADRGNGNYFYIDSLAEARKVLVEQGAANLVTLARDVKVQVEMNPARVAEYRLLGYENRLMAARDFANDAVDGGEIGPGHTVTALYEITPPGAAEVDGVPLKYQTARTPTEPQSDELFTVKVRYQPPQGGESALISKAAREVHEALADMSDDFRLAAGVATFGMMLRESPHRGQATWAMAEGLVEAGIGVDPGGHRRGLLALVQKASSLQLTKAAVPND